MEHIDNPAHNDNRQYVYTDSFYMRPEFPIIADWIPDGASVIDLGCGNGALMQYLIQHNHVVIEGVDVALSGIASGLALGLRAHHGQIDVEETYERFSDKQFDYAICNVTIQMVMYPEVLLGQMQRIARFSIISFPNFAHITQRLDLLIHGRMPRPLLYGYTWYNTGHIHQASMTDVTGLFAQLRMRVLATEHVGRWKHIARWLLPNLFSKEVIFLIQN